ncbi:MAG: chemotaxis protein CheD [Chloroflexi bacterium]|nr:chemotaxis protein CheD [Chloroflexota bacterium]
MENSVSVGLGEIAISRNPDEVLVAYGLGSCLGIGVYDPVARVAGLLHAVLPESPNGSSVNGSAAKYVNTGIAELMKSLEAAGGSPARAKIRVIGGANMLLSSSLSKTFDIGTRNIEASRKTFEKMKLKVSAEEVGGHTGRTVRLFVHNGRMTFRIVGGKEQEI